MEAIRLYIDSDLSGLSGDWARLERNFALLQSRVGPDNPRLRSVMAFWHEVQGRHEEAAGSFALVDVVPEPWTPPEMGGNASYGLMETAQVRIYRQAGREAEAQQLVDSRLSELRTAHRAVGDSCDWKQLLPGWMRHASLAANEGLRDEAVQALEGALRCGELLPYFRPQLPWFRSLEGYPPYDALLKERDRRVAAIRAELLALEAESGIATPGP